MHSVTYILLTDTQRETGKTIHSVTCILYKHFILGSYVFNHVLFIDALLFFERKKINTLSIQSHTYYLQTLIFLEKKEWEAVHSITYILFKKDFIFLERNVLCYVLS